MRKAALVLLFTLICIAGYAGKKSVDKANVTFVDSKNCFECHETVKTLHERGSHAGVNCGFCHSVPKEHSTEPSEKNRPTVRTDHRACAQCHDAELNDMLNTKYHMSWAGKNGAASYQLVKRADGSFQNVQTRIPRYHVGILADLTVNRMGGRYDYKPGYSEAVPVEKLWDSVQDLHPEDGDNMYRTRPSTAWRPQKMKGIASTAFCLKCKSADNILDYSYLGRKGTGAPLDLKSPIFPTIKKMETSFNCNFCHDPHSAEPRVVNDILIEGMADPKYKDNGYQKNAGKTMAKAEIIKMGERGYERRIAILERPDSNLMCGQCHMAFHTAVTYKDRDTDEKFSGTDFGNLSTTLFTKSPLENQEYYKKHNLYNKVHPVTGTKYASMEDHAQLEIVSQSAHGKAGVGCTDCHFAKTADGHMEHQPSLPTEKTAMTCLRSDCHGAGTTYNWTQAEQALYQIEVIQQKARNQLTYLRTEQDKIIAYMKRVIDGEISVSKDSYAKLDNALERALTVVDFWQTDYSQGVHDPKLHEETVFTSMKELNTALAEAKKTEKKLK